MSDPTLTDTERVALGRHVPATLSPVDADGISWGRTDTLAVDRLAETVERIVAARVAEAVDRERATWATKVSGLADEWAGAREPDGGVSLAPVVAMAAELRALLAADDTEAKP